MENLRNDNKDEVINNDIDYSKELLFRHVHDINKLLDDMNQQTHIICTKTYIFDKFGVKDGVKRDFINFDENYIGEISLKDENDNIIDKLNVILETVDYILENLDNVI